jgi:hypothetical protein
VHRVLIVCALALFCGPRVVDAQQPVRTQDGGIIVNFQSAELAFVLATLARAANINFFATDLPSKQVTLSTQGRAISPAEARVLIRNLAEANGVTVVETGPAMQLQGVPQATADARQLFIHRLKHARAPILAQTLQLLFGGVKNIKFCSAVKRQ